MRQCSVRQDGFSLVEILVATALSVFLLTAVMTVYLSQKKSYRFTEGLARVQENGRLAIAGLNKDVRMAGYIGCGRLSEIRLHNLLPGIDFRPETSIVGFNNGQTTASYSSPTVDAILRIAVPKTAVLIVQHADAESVVASHDQQIKVPADQTFKVGDVALLSNCQQAHIFRVQAVHQQWLTPMPQFTDRYEWADSQMSRLLTYIYYVANTGRINQAGNPIYALYRRNLNDAPTKQNEWVEGVENMQIVYGIFDPKTTMIYYATADKVLDWKQVISVKIALLLNSIEEIGDSHLPYTFQGKIKMAGDCQLRREWETVIYLRNRNY